MSFVVIPEVKCRPWLSNYCLVFWWNMVGCSSMSSGKWFSKASYDPPSSKSLTPHSPNPSKNRNSKTGSEVLSNYYFPPSTLWLSSTSSNSGCSFSTSSKFMKLAFSATATRFSSSWVSLFWVNYWIKSVKSFKPKNGKSLTDSLKELLRKHCQLRYLHYKTGRKKSKCQKNATKANRSLWTCSSSSCNKSSKSTLRTLDKQYFLLLLQIISSINKQLNSIKPSIEGFNNNVQLRKALWEDGFFSNVKSLPGLLTQQYELTKIVFSNMF